MIMFSKQTTYSLAQFLFMFSDKACFLLKKHDINVDRDPFQEGNLLEDLGKALENAASEKIRSLLDDIGCTANSLRSDFISKAQQSGFGRPATVFDERFDELRRCLCLDGYRFCGRHESDYSGLIALDSSALDESPTEDDLTRQINDSLLPQSAKTEISERLRQSNEAILKTPPDFNACLTNARIALETLAKAMSDSSKWGKALAELKRRGVISEKDEEFLAAVYGWISDGAHRPMGMSDEEMTMLGRRIILPVCWFLTRRFKSSGSH